MNTKTLDDKLRERADQRLTEEIKAAIGSIAVMQNKCSRSPMVKVGKEEIELFRLYEPIRIALFEELRERRQQDEVDAFLRSVESTADRINELRSE